MISYLYIRPITNFQTAYHIIHIYVCLSISLPSSSVILFLFTQLFEMRDYVESFRDA